MQLKLASDAFDYVDMTRFEAFRRELEAWDGTPRMFLLFDKAPLSTRHLFMTIDPRATRICGVEGVETFDFTQPARDWSGVVERNIKKKVA